MGKEDHDGHDPRALTLTLEMSTLSTLLVTLESFAAGASVGTVALTGAAFVLATAATVHNVMMCKRIVDAVVNAKKDKEGEKVGKEGTGEAGKETGDSETKNRKFKKAKSGTGKEKATNVPSWS